MGRKYIITTGGGLGNQLLNYALFVYLKNRGEKVTYYLRKDTISNIFHLRYETIPPSNFKTALVRYFKVICRIKNKLLRNKRMINSFLNITLVDFPEWTNYQFIDEVKPLLMNDFEFPDDHNSKNNRVKKLMKTTNSVSIHVRRGDYQNSIYWRLILGDVCTEDYYIKAIKKVNSLIDSPQYFVFSDDINWVKEHIDIQNPIFVYWNKGDNSFRDMELMTYCKINIIANSTFSLMAAWLNINPSPIRIVPLKWLNNINDNLCDKYIPSSWIKINNVRPTISIITDFSDKYLMNILSQSYSDFEIIAKSEAISNIKDLRIRYNQEPNGRFIFYTKEDDIVLFKNNNYLKKWIKDKYINEVEDTDE